jgi:hypothetical protein
VVCKDGSNNDVVGQALAADNGDGAGSSNGGPDEITCTFTETAPSACETSVTDTILVGIQEGGGGVGQGSDSAIIKTSTCTHGGITDILVGGASNGPAFGAPSGTISAYILAALAAALIAVGSAAGVAVRLAYLRRRR